MNNIRGVIFTLFNISVKICFLLFSISALYMLYSIFFENLYGFIILFIFVLCISGFFYEYIVKFLRYFVSKIDNIKKNNMIIILSFIFILLYFLYSLLIYSDFSSFADSTVYVNIANKIISNNANQIGKGYTHVIFMGIYLSIPKIIGISYRAIMVGTFLIGTIFYFLIGCKIFGKNISFLTILLYIFMPSTIMFSMLIVHEIYVYAFIAVGFYIYLSLIDRVTMFKLLIFFVILILLCYISPISLIVLTALAVCSIIIKSTIRTKIFILLTIISAFVVSSQSTKVILSNLTSEEFTQGSPIACNFNIGLNSKYAGHFNPEDAANVEALLETNKLKGVNKNQNDICLELVNNKLLDYQKNPVKIIDLVLGKFYKTWRGPFHPIEAGASLDRTFNGSRNQIYYWIFTAISESMYLIICLMGFFACKIKKQDTDEIILFQCLLLGMVVTLLIVETMNKYSLHQTIGIFFCSVYCLRYSLELDFKKGD